MGTNMAADEMLHDNYSRQSLESLTHDSDDEASPRISDPTPPQIQPVEKATTQSQGPSQHTIEFLRSLEALNAQNLAAEDVNVLTTTSSNKPMSKAAAKRKMSDIFVKGTKRPHVIKPSAAPAPATAEAAPRVVPEVYIPNYLRRNT